MKFDWHGGLISRGTALSLLLLLFSVEVLAKDTTAPSGDVVILASFEYPPFMENPKGSHRPGLAIEIMREAFRRMGRPLKVEFYPFSRISLVLDEGLVDGVFTIKKTPERELKYIFSNQAIVRQDYVIFSSKDSNFKYNGHIEELADKSVGVLSKASYGMVFDNAVGRGQFRRLEVAFNHESNFRKLVAHRMDVVICSRIVGVEILKRLALTDKVIVTGPPIETANSFLMLSKKDSNYLLVSAFDKALASMRADGALANIEKEYLN